MGGSLESINPATGRKRYETRSWATSYRGPIAVHAGMKCHVEFCNIFGLISAEIPAGAVVAIRRFGGLRRNDA